MVLGERNHRNILSLIGRRLLWVMRTDLLLLSYSEGNLMLLS